MTMETYHLPIDQHLHDICTKAGLGVMAGVLSVVRDRETVEDATLLSCSSEDVTAFYEMYIGPAIDHVERRLLGEDYTLTSTEHQLCDNCGIADDGGFVLSGCRGSATGAHHWITPDEDSLAAHLLPGERTDDELMRHLALGHGIDANTYNEGDDLDDRHVREHKERD